MLRWPLNAAGTPPPPSPLARRAEPGGPGLGSDMHGAGSKDLVIKVPPGTIVRLRDAPPGTPPLAEVLAAGDRALLAAGGRGGRGNLAFKTARNNAPALAEFGEKGQGEWAEGACSCRVCSMGGLGGTGGGRRCRGGPPALAG